jgi:hypothetical protein
LSESGLSPTPLAIKKNKENIRLTFEAEYRTERLVVVMPHFIFLGLRDISKEHDLDRKNLKDRIYFI